MAIPLVTGEKSQKEKFAGALNTYTIEALMPDGQALQSGTSHDLGQNFANAFDVQFLDSDGTHKHVWSTSWGISTRIIGALIMVHGDDKGLRLPPRVAPIQAVVIPIVNKTGADAINAKARELAKRLTDAGLRVECDDRDGYRPGWKYSEYEMKGVPLRVEIGAKDMEKNQVCLVRRDTGEKMFIPEVEMEETAKRLMEEIQQGLFKQAKEILDTKTFRANSFEEFN